jgi:hypothetical protein
VVGNSEVIAICARAVSKLEILELLGTALSEQWRVYLYLRSSHRQRDQVYLCTLSCSLLDQSSVACKARGSINHNNNYENTLNSDGL